MNLEDFTITEERNDYNGSCTYIVNKKKNRKDSKKDSCGLKSNIVFYDDYMFEEGRRVNK